MVEAVEQTRLKISRSTAAEKKSRLGQFLTPACTASFMAGMFPLARGDCRLLDAGAGIGSLSAALLERWKSGEIAFARVDVDAFELDPALLKDLEATLKGFSGKFSYRIFSEDFISTATDSLAGNMFAKLLPQYTHAILNPPYKKMASDSPHRLALRRVGIETVNLYTAFVALAVALVAPGGQIVAIIPRSFCNGPYYRPFRDFVLERAALHHIHLFESRTSAFKDDAVLQENVIIRLERGGVQREVTITTSSDDSFKDLITRSYGFDQIVFPDDRERFIHVPNDNTQVQSKFYHTLADLNIQVSTGPIVDFRMRDFLRPMPVSGTTPLVYTGHLSIVGTTWPITDFKKPNAIVLDDTTRRWMYPNGWYCAVRRFSSKEEKRRVVAGVVDPLVFAGYELLGFENHTNVFHQNKQGLPEQLARGLALYLNSTAVDLAFRRFNGHTQVNATDLRQMKYPSFDELTVLGNWARTQKCITQEMIDKQLDGL